jgi:RNA-directed DNA polymerase
MAASLLEQIASEASLWQAWDEVCSARGAPGVDGVSVRDFAREAAHRIPHLAERLRTHRYRARPLRRVWVPKRGKENEYRPLTIPAVRDRIASRAAHHTLEHVFEPMLHDSSFGYRRGRGTLAALRRVMRLRDLGSRWVARGDIDDFFGSVDQHLLFHELEPHLPSEVRRLLLLWTRAWIHDGAERFRLRQGLPQGTATSPLLANLYLTPFDENLAFEGVEAIRYVDDLVALARTERAARAALDTFAVSLAPLALHLNADSRQVRSFDEGFEFLGFELRGQSLRVAPSKILAFRRHALMVLEHPGGGSMRLRIARLNQMIRGWRAYYRIGIPREQFKELDEWLEGQVRAARLLRWGREQPPARELELAGLESLANSGRRIFQPPPPPSVEGYEYRVPLEGEREYEHVLIVPAAGDLALEADVCYSVGTSGEWAAVDPKIRAVVIADGAVCDAGALRWLLDRGIALRFVASTTHGAGVTTTSA